MTVAIIDYGSGNLRSAAKAFEYAAEGRAGRTGRTDIVVTADPDIVVAADQIVLPGVGAFADCMFGLTAIDGMIDAMTEAAITKGTPFLGICVGMQLMATCGLEHGRTNGLDWIPGEVTKLTPADTALKVPHMGWNELVFATPNHPLLAGLPVGAHAYFVHSYCFTPSDPAAVIAHADYGGVFAAMVGRDNLVGTQFHPEKSQAVGLALIANFLAWQP
ncbi:MAG: imidazole glycerol phosphate synthase subunit HisH [Alphaproteobacteria bacterium]